MVLATVAYILYVFNSLALNCFHCYLFLFKSPCQKAGLTTSAAAPSAKLGAVALVALVTLVTPDTATLREHLNIEQYFVRVRLVVEVIVFLLFHVRSLLIIWCNNSIDSRLRML